MKKLFSLFAAVLMAGSMMAENPNLIKFTEPAAAGSLNGQTFGSEFTLTITDTGNKVSVDANSATFGVSEEETISFTLRLKTGGKSSATNKMTLVVPEEGMLVVYARTASSSATDRSFFITNGSDTIMKHLCLDTDTVEGASSKIFLPAIKENVPAGIYEVTYSAAINFYGFDMPVEEEAAPAKLGTFSISSAEINEGKVGDIALATNGYGSQAVADPATWYTCAKGDYTFKGAKVCMATTVNGGGLQMQGNAGNVANMGFFGNATAFNNIHSLKVVLRTTSTSTYDPAFNVYTDSLGTTNVFASADTVKTTEGNFKKYVYTYTYAEPGKFFNIKNDLAGVLYIDTIYVIYEKGDEPVISVADPVFSVAAGSYYDAQKVAITCETEGAEIHYTLDGTEPSAASALYTDSLTISVTTTVKAVAVKDANVSKVVSKTYEIAVAYASFDELVNQAGAPAGQKVVVNFSNVVIDSLYVSSSNKTNGVYLTAAGRMVEIYCYDVPAEWEVGGTISGTVKGEWKDYKGTWEVCPSSWEGINYAAPVVTKYYFKHPWNGGDWTWKEAADTTFLGIEASYVVAQWGDNGFNFHTEAADAGAAWYEKEVIGTITPDGTPAIGYPAKGTEVTFICLHEDHTHAVGGGRAWIVYVPATAIENTTDVKAVKVIENGQVVILKNGKKFNLMGAEL